jgi:hypothetical protein
MIRVTTSRIGSTEWLAGRTSRGPAAHDAAPLVVVTGSAEHRGRRRFSWVSVVTL